MAQVKLKGRQKLMALLAALPKEVRRELKPAME